MHAGICAFAVGHNDATTYSSCAAAADADAGARRWPAMGMQMYGHGVQI